MTTSADRTIVLCGDSLVEWGEWQDWLKGYRVYNQGLAGETVQGLLKRLPSILNRFSGVWLYIIMTGINNIAMEDYKMLSPYREILRQIRKQSPSSEILVNSILPVNLEWVDNRRIREINVSLSEICREEGAIFLDIHDYFLSSDGSAERRYLLEDGVHLSNEGYALWSHHLLEKIRTLEGKNCGF